VFRGGFYMSEQQVMYGICAQRSSAEVGKYDLPVTAWWLAKPGFQHGHCGFGKRNTSFLPSLPNYSNMSAGTEDEIISSQVTHFRLAKPRLRCNQ
jgi:hypothetical protein